MKVIIFNYFLLLLFIC